MGEIITLNDGLYSYELPKMPSDEKDILYHNLPKKQQYWRTPYDTKKLLDIPNIKRLNEREKIEMIELWRRRWIEGMWFFSNGEPKYLTGLHMDHLVFNTFNSKKLMYFDDERFIFYFVDLTENAPECDGRAWVKPRRAKMTTIICSVAQYKLLKDFSQYITIQSDTLEKAQKSFMTPIIDCYVKRPAWMREEFYSPNGKKPRKSLELVSNVLKEEGNDLLGGRINIFPTVARATDGLEAIECIQDEYSKWANASPYETFEVNRKVIHNFRKQGKIDCLSSTGDSDDYLNAVMDWQKLIANSNPKIKDDGGKTTSGLWKYFISAIHSQYAPSEFTNIYGIVNKEKAEEWIWNEINKYPKGSKPYIFALYRLCLTEQHALMSSALSTNFNKIKIAARLQELNSMLPNNKPYIIGNFEEDIKGKVWFEADPNGKWYLVSQPYFSTEKNIDARNRYRNINGVLFPPINPEGAGGYDPINYHKQLTTSSHLSRASIFFRKKFDYYNKEGDNDFYTGIMALYLDRPDDPRDANKEAIKGCKFFGYPMMHERSVSHVFEDFETAGMLPFLLKDESGTFGISPSNMTAKKDGLSMLQTRYSNPKSVEDYDELSNYPFEDGLNDLDNYDIANTNAFDITMSEIYCEHGLKQVQLTNITDQSINRMNDVIREILPPRKRLMV